MSGTIRHKIFRFYPSKGEEIQLRNGSLSVKEHISQPYFRQVLVPFGCQGGAISWRIWRSAVPILALFRRTSYWFGGIFGSSANGWQICRSPGGYGYRQSQIKSVGCFCHFFDPKWRCMESYIPLPLRNSLCLLNWKFRLICSSGSIFEPKTFFWDSQSLPKKWLSSANFSIFPYNSIEI